MAEARQTPFQTATLTGQTSSGIVESSASKIAGQLQDLLTSGVQAADNALGNQAAILHRQNLETEAMANLVDASKQADISKATVTEQNINATNQQAMAQTNQKLAIAGEQFSDTINLSRHGLTAYLANHSPAEIKNLLDNGAAQAIDPLGYLELEKQSGVRLAMQDVPGIIAEIHRAGPTKPVEQIIQEAANKAAFQTPLARAAYLERLSGDVNSFQNGELLSLMDQTRRKNTENLSNVLSVDIAKDITDPTIDQQDLPMKFIQHVAQFQQDYKVQNPRTASDQDVLNATTNAFKTFVSSGALNKMAPERLIPMFNGVKGLMEKDPRYLPLLGAIGDDVRQQVGAVYAMRGKVIEDQINSATDQTSLLSAGSLMKSEVDKGNVDPNKISVFNKAFQDKQMQLQDRMNADVRIYQQPGFKGAPLQDTESQDKQLDISMRRYFAEHGNLNDDGTPVTQASYMTRMLDLTGRITRDNMSALNAAASINITDKSTADQVKEHADAMTTIAALKKENPAYMITLNQNKKLDDRLFVVSTLLGDDGNGNITSLTKRAQAITPVRMAEARSALAQNVVNSKVDPTGQYTSPEDLRNAVVAMHKFSEDWFDTTSGSHFWGNMLTFDANYVSKAAEQAAQSSYYLNFAEARNNGATEADAHRLALSETSIDQKQNYPVYDFGSRWGNNRYVINKNTFPILQTAEAQKDPDATMKRFGDAFLEFKEDAAVKYKSTGQVGSLFTRDNAIPLIADTDAATVEPGDKYGPMMVLPVTFRNQPAGAFRYPVTLQGQMQLQKDKDAQKKADNEKAAKELFTEGPYYGQYIGP